MIAENIWAEANGIPMKFELARDLLESPAKIERAETDLHAAKLRVAAEKDEHAAQEGRILIAAEDPKVLGANAEQRTARIRVLLEPFQTAIRAAEADLLVFERTYNMQVNHFRALRAVAALIAGEER
jgi:hypothetical protein